MIYRLEGTLLIEADDEAEAASILAEINQRIESMDVCGDLQMAPVIDRPADEWWERHAFWGTYA